MIKRIYVDNYRCFSNFELKPAKISLILGANGSGKTSLLDVVSCIVGLVVQGMDVVEVFPTKTLTRWISRNEQRFELDVSDGQGVFRYELVVKHDRERELASIVREVVTQYGRTLFRYEDGMVHLHSNDGREGATFPFRSSQSFLAGIEEREGTENLIWLLRFFSDLWTLSLQPQAMETASAMEAEALTRDGSNFASWYRHLQQDYPERIAGYFSNLGEVLPGFCSLKLISSSARSRNRDLIVTFSQEEATYQVDFDELSDGQRVLVVFYALLLSLDGGRKTLLLDEPGSHLAITEIQPWLLELDDALGDVGQLIVTSHNSEVIDHLAAEHPLWFDRVDGGPVRVRDAIFEREAGLKASEQLAIGALSGE